MFEKFFKHLNPFHRIRIGHFSFFLFCCCCCQFLLLLYVENNWIMEKSERNHLYRIFNFVKNFSEKNNHSMMMEVDKSFYAVDDEFMSEKEKDICFKYRSINRFVVVVFLMEIMVFLEKTKIFFWSRWFIFIIIIIILNEYDDNPFLSLFPFWILLYRSMSFETTNNIWVEKILSFFHHHHHHKNMKHDSV